MMKPPQLTKIGEIVSRISRVIPTTYYGILNKEFRGNFTILDVACGPGIPMYTLNRHKKYQVTGVDLFEEYLNIVKNYGVYHAVVQSDIRKMPFQDGSFDAVNALHIIEHLEKEEGVKFMAELERIARRKVIIATPVGFLKQGGYDNNDLQEHKSGWEPEEFEKMGYRVIGQCWKPLNGNNTISRLCNSLKLFGIFRDIFSAIIQPFISKYPSRCYQMICIKEKK